MKHLSDYIVFLKERGDFYFTSQQALEFLDIAPKAFIMSLVRLRQKKEIITLSKAFHIIVTPEYFISGCLPASYFIDAYMKFLKLPYYISLLSAAEYHGAAHQKSQIFQVITNKQLNPIRCGKVVIKFIYKKKFEDVPITIFNVPTGYVKVSTPEATAMDLLMYRKESGGLNSIATILTELVANIDPIKLLQLANNSLNKTAWTQRLGYILEQLDPIETENRNEIVTTLKQFISDKKMSYVLLSQNNDKEITKNNLWKVVVNCKIESDI